MGDWVAHPSNTVARRILVTYPLLADVSGEGSPEPPGIRMNNPTEFILCPMIIIFLPPCFLSPLAEGACKPKVQVQDALWSHCKTEALFSHARNQLSKPSAEMELVRWPRATRSTTCEQDRSVCVILHISSWRYGHIVTLFWCINDDCNMCVCVCDFASQETCLSDYLCAVQFFVWFTYSLASMKKNKPTGTG
jgi:hypothetical protein